MKKNILITGGWGFIGSNLVHYLLKNHPDYLIVNYDKLTYAGNPDNLKDIETNTNYIFVNGDICNIDKLNETFEKYEITDVIHLAAESHVDRSIVDPYIFEKTNVHGTHCLLNAAMNYWEKNFGTLEGHRFHHVSTDEVYGSLDLDTKEKFTEETKYDPHSPYSASKASSDHFVKAFHDTYGMDVTISNCSNNYGPYQYPEKLIPVVLNCIMNEKPIPVYGKGENIRDWLYVEDHCSAIDFIFHNGKSGETYNVGGNSEKTNIELINIIIDKYTEYFTDMLSNARNYIYSSHFTEEQYNSVYNGLNEKLKKLITYVTDRKGHDLRYAIDSSKLEYMGWKPVVSFEDGIKKTIAFYYNNLKSEWAKTIEARKGLYDKGWWVENMYWFDEGGIERCPYDTIRGVISNYGINI